MGCQQMQAKLPVPVLQSHRQLFSLMDAAAIGHHDNLLLSFAKDDHYLMDILPKRLDINVGIEMTFRADTYSRKP